MERAILPVLLLACVASCASAGRPPPAEPVAAAPVESAQVAAPPPPPECALHCEPAQMLPRLDPMQPDYTQEETEDAGRVLDAMRPDLLQCYARRVRAYPQAHGFITVDVVIGPDGSVRAVETTGGAVLGETTMGCIVKRIERARFAPPHGGGTLRVRVPFSLRAVRPGDDTT
jgi:hypothetical protein